ncbi:MAG: GNAT family N-acetyltransferase [Betaproteobacteria bacterium]|nr:GNAT family N-acetyltransferase [Betaproteobacteria bacterium]
MTAIAEADVAAELRVCVARTDEEVAAALRLRHQVFVQELGARGTAEAGLECDAFDAHCRHLIVREGPRGAVVGTYRVLMPQGARAIGRLYAEGEFDLGRLAPIRDDLVELGRACVRADHRGGPVLMLLWGALSALLADSGHRYLIGCVSVPMADGGRLAADLYRRLADTHLAGESLRVWPRARLPLETLAPLPSPAPLPPLLKGYLRAGARLLGEPHHDADFGCADLPLLLNVDALSARYRRRFGV